MKKTINILKVLGSFLALIIVFVVGIADRVILIFLPWKEMPKLTDKRYFSKAFESSFIRVFLVGMTWFVYWFLKSCFVWIWG